MADLTWVSGLHRNWNWDWNWNWNWIFNLVAYNKQTRRHRQAICADYSELVALVNPKINSVGFLTNLVLRHAGQVETDAGSIHFTVVDQPVQHATNMLNHEDRSTVSVGLTFIQSPIERLVESSNAESDTAAEQRREDRKRDLQPKRYVATIAGSEVRLVNATPSATTDWLRDRDVLPVR